MSLLFDWRKAIAASDDLPSTARLVALVLATHMNGHGGSCYPSIEMLVCETRLSRRSVQRALAELEQAGLLEREKTGGRGRATQYQALLKGATRGALSGAKGRQVGRKRAPETTVKGATGGTPGLQEDVQEDVPPQPPQGGEQHRGADAQSEDRLAALDIDPSPFGADEEARDVAH